MLTSSRRRASNCASSNRSSTGAVTTESYHVLLLIVYCDMQFRMAFRECRVTFRDVRDIEHSVTVQAETTMDAAALGLKRIRAQKFVINLPDAAPARWVLSP